LRAYKTLFCLDVEHTFFASGTLADVHFVPISATSVILNKAGLLSKETGNGLSVFYDHHGAEVLRLFAADLDEPLRFSFKAFSQDRAFDLCTETPSKPEAILHFDTAKAKLEGSGRLRLHEQDYVSDGDFVPFTSPLLDDLLSPKDRLLKPTFTITVHIAKEDVSGFDEPGTIHPRHYYIRFHAREMVWKYYVLGNLAKRNAYIADANNGTEFEALGETALTDHRRALLFRSKRPIPLRERTEYRFQLRERGSGVGKVLIQRLPVATADNFYKETIDGQEVMVSEVYVNF